MVIQINEQLQSMTRKDTEEKKTEARLDNDNQTKKLFKS